MSSERALVTIVFSDAVGFSKLAHESEEQALALIEQDFEIFREVAAQHRGEVIKSTGDGLLIVYQSAVEGVQSTLTMVKAMAARPNTRPQLKHRFGIHLGDVTRTENDVVGDGVNIAARLQSEAPIGGIALSRTIYDVVSGKTFIPAIRMGETQLKNITRPVEMWHIMPDALDAVSPSAPVVSKSKLPPALAISLAVVFVATVTTFFVTRGSKSSPSPKPAIEVPQSGLIVTQASQGTMGSGPDAGEGSLDFVISGKSTIPSGVTAYELSAKLEEEGGLEYPYTVKAQMAFTPGTDEVIQIPLKLVNPKGVTANTKGTYELTVAGKTASGEFILRRQNHR